TGDVISRNSIFDNGGLGIDVGADGLPTTSGAPTLTRASGAGGNLTVKGSAPAGATVELFAAAPDPSGYGEGKTYLTSFTATGSFTFTLPQPAGVVVGSVLTATATNGSTSEFSNDVTVVPNSPTTFTVVNTNDGGAGSLRQAILDANAGAGADTI